MVVSPGLTVACETFTPGPNNCGSFGELPGAVAKVVPASVTGSTTASPVLYYTNTLEGPDYEARPADKELFERPGFIGPSGAPAKP